MGSRWWTALDWLRLVWPQNRLASVAADAPAAVLKLAMSMARIEYKAVPFWASLPFIPRVYSNCSDTPATSGQAPPTSYAEPEPSIGTAVSRSAVGTAFLDAAAATIGV